MGEIVTAEMVTQYCLLIKVINWVFHLLYQVVYGISICNICNNDGIHGILYRNMLSNEQKLAVCCAL